MPAGFPIAIADPGLASTSALQTAGNTVLANILTAVSSPHVETLWTDDSNAYYVRIDNAGTITWATPTGTTSSGPGTGARPATGASIIVSGTQYQAVATSVGFYTINDFITHVVTTDPSTGIVISSFWLNSSTSVKLVTGPPSSDISPVSPLPTGGATSALQSTANTLLTSIIASLAGTIKTASPSVLATTSTSVNGSASDTTLHTFGPFTPQLARDIWVTIVGTGASGTAQLLRSTDGGTTKLGITTNGEPWALWSFSSLTGSVVNEATASESSTSATYYLTVTLTAGSVTCSVYQ